MRKRKWIVAIPIAVLAYICISRIFISFAVSNGDNIEVASIKGDVKRVELLLRYNSSLANLKGYHNYTPLHWAAMGGYKKIVEMLLDSGADVNSISEERVSPLYLTVLKGHCEIAQILLEKGADPNVHCHYLGAFHGGMSTSNLYDEVTPLHIAVERSNLRLVKMLVAAGADVNAFDGDNRTPLYYANGPKYTAVVLELLKHGALTDLKDSSGKQLPIIPDNLLIAKKLLANKTVSKRDLSAMLSAAASDGNVPMVQYFLDMGADPNFGITEHYAPIIQAIDSVHWIEHDLPNQDRKGVLELLISHGADVNAKDKDGQTATDIAASNGRKELADLLRAHGGIALGAFAYAVEGNVEKMRALLCANPSLVNAKRPCGCESLLECAVRYHRMAVVKLLFSSNVSPTRDNMAWTLKQALENRDAAMVNMLIDHGADIKNPYIFVSAAGSQKMVDLLKSRGAKLDIEKDGHKLLIDSAMRLKPDKVKYFIDRGAKINPQVPGVLSMLKQIMAQESSTDSQQSQYYINKHKTLKLLFANGAQTIIRHKGGSDIVMQEAEHGIDCGTLEALLRHGADVNRVNPEYFSTPLERAKDPETISILLKYGARVSPPQQSGGYHLLATLRRFLMRLFHP